MSKLYTEEQVKQMIEKSRETGLTAEYIILTTPSIQLPTDGDAYQEVKHRDLYESSTFILGVQWMRNKIQGGQDE